MSADAGTQLERALVRNAADAGIALAMVAATATPWVSVTFTGARHRFTLAAARSASLDAWLADLAEAEFRLRGHLVADLVVAGTTHTGEPAQVMLEALTVEDC